MPESQLDLYRQVASAAGLITDKDPGAIPDQDRDRDRDQDQSCTITSKTVTSAPDGTADSRKEVGVEERVQLTCSSPAVWSSLTGSFDSTYGSTVEWTAPSHPASAIITADPDAGDMCSITITSFYPKKETTDFLRWGRFFSGDNTRAKWSGTLHPLSMSFSGLEVTEVDTGGGTNTCCTTAEIVARHPECLTGLTQFKPWKIADDNTWREDTIGWNSPAVRRIAAKGITPCELRFPQSMQLVRTGQNFEYQAQKIGSKIKPVIGKYGPTVEVSVWRIDEGKAVDMTL